MNPKKRIDLKKQFSEEIESLFSFDYSEGIRNNPDMGLHICEFSGDLVESIYIGNVCSIMPSGKYYMPWTTNQTLRDEIMDFHFMEMLEKRCDNFGLFVRQDGTDMFVESSVGDFVSTEDYETFYQFGKCVAASVDELEEYFIDSGVFDAVVHIDERGYINYHHIDYKISAKRYGTGRRI
jgi:hypothetical protein